MVYSLFTSVAQSSLVSFSDSPNLNSSKSLVKRTHALFLKGHTSFPPRLSRLGSTRPPLPICFFSGGGNPKRDFEDKVIFQLQPIFYSLNHNHYNCKLRSQAFCLKSAGKWRWLADFEAVGCALGMANSVLNITRLWVEVSSAFSSSMFK